MKRSERDLWQSATTLAGLGELTAQWLEGKISSQPGYADGCGPDEETTPLAGTLAAACRAGLVTTNSQPGADFVGVTGGRVVQRATVHAFADEVAYEWLPDAAGGAGLWVCAGKAAARRIYYATCDEQTVSRWRVGWGQKGTRPDLGVCLSCHHIRDSWVGYGVCSRQAQDALCEAWQVTLIDPEPDRNDRLWPLLDRLAAHRSPR